MPRVTVKGRTSGGGNSLAAICTFLIAVLVLSVGSRGKKQKGIILPTLCLSRIGHAIRSFADSAEQDG
jgi:hypothetical protein